MTVDGRLNCGDQFRSVKGKSASGLVSLRNLKNIIFSHNLRTNRKSFEMRKCSLGKFMPYQNGSTSAATKQSLWYNWFIQTKGFTGKESAKCKSANEFWSFAYDIRNSEQPLSRNPAGRISGKVFYFQIQHKEHERPAFSKAQLIVCKESFFETGAWAWNNILQSIKDARSIVAFKKF